MKNPEKYDCGLKYPNAGDSMLPRGSGPASGRFPEFHVVCAGLPHKMGGLAGMGNCKMHRFDLWVLEFMISNITGNNQRGNCITLDFNFRGLSEPRNQQKLEPHD